MAYHTSHSTDRNYRLKSSNEWESSNILKIIPKFIDKMLKNECLAAHVNVNCIMS